MPRLAAVATVIVAAHVLLTRRSSAWTEWTSTARKITNTNSLLARPFSSHTSPLPPTRLRAAKDDSDSADRNKKSSHDDSDSDEEARRMSLVRSLQMAYYTARPPLGRIPEGEMSWDVLPSSQLDPHTGTLQRLPLWRSGWSEVPGRSNVLHVHDPVYTNMFEKILYGAASSGTTTTTSINLPRYFGHLYLPGGNKNLSRDAAEPFRLKTWQDESESTKTSDISRSAVLGCLMKIADYRRLSDGRLLLLVHATERFVVTKVHQELPYSVADVQILPDDEERDFVAGRVDFNKYNLANARARNDCTIIRALTVQESLRHHSFEYDDHHSLPVPTSTSGIQVADIVGSQLRRVLPFAPFSSTESVPAVEDMDVTVLTSTSTNLKNAVAPTPANDDIKSNDEHFSLERQLLEGRILYSPRPHPELIRHGSKNESGDECDDLEYKLWLALNDRLVSDRVAVSPILLGLVPKNIHWPSNFALQTINSGLGNVLEMIKQEQNNDKSFSTPSLNNDFVEMPPEYPKHRRQRRLSYAAAQLLEREMTDFDEKVALRQSLLAAPSTAARLRLVLERFELQRSCGEFE